MLFVSLIHKLGIEVPSLLVAVFVIIIFFYSHFLSPTTPPALVLSRTTKNTNKILFNFFHVSHTVALPSSSFQAVTENKKWDSEFLLFFSLTMESVLFCAIQFVESPIFRRRFISRFASILSLAPRLCVKYDLFVFTHLSHPRIECSNVPIRRSLPRRELQLEPFGAGIYTFRI